MRTERIDKSTIALDSLEQKWWNENAEGIEKIWALNYEYQKLIRLPYLKNMKDFFLEGNPNKKIKILEVGCGSGWVCRMIADENIHVFGTDFSASQIEIAKQQAMLFNKSNYCTYKLADVSDFNADIDAVVIHAILHHLSKEELDLFFSQIKNIKPGCKVFLYEPVFIKPQNIKPTIKDKVLHRAINFLRNSAIKYAKKFGRFNHEIKNQLESIYADASKNGWYLSPKEVPFYQDELYAFLEPSFVIKKEYIVNKTDLEVAQTFVLNSFERPSRIFSNLFFKLIISLDKLSFKGNFTNYIKPLQHQFVCFELVRKQD